jgi:tRNA C32,U32 (ribose-2'-O)-methylase TrmJ
VAGAGDHVSDAVGDVFGREDLGLPVEEVDHLVA